MNDIRTEAMAERLGMQYLVDRFQVKEVYTAYEFSNRIARNLYASFGFVETGEVAGHEVEMKCVLDDVNTVLYKDNVIIHKTSCRRG